MYAIIWNYDDLNKKLYIWDNSNKKAWNDLQVFYIVDATMSTKFTKPSRVINIYLCLVCSMDSAFSIRVLETHSLTGKPEVLFAQH